MPPEQWEVNGCEHWLRWQVDAGTYGTGRLSDFLSPALLARAHDVWQKGSELHKVRA